MPESMNSETQEAFKKLLQDSPAWEDTEATFEETRAKTQEMVERLEAKYADRGLKFTQNFNGACPVQAFGHIDGGRFYFRFRGNWAQLRVGPYDAVYEQRYTDKLNEMADLRESKRVSEGRETSWFTPSAHKPQNESDKDFYPHLYSATASLEGADPNDVFNGYLTDDEAFEVFSSLADTLESGSDLVEYNQKKWDWLDQPVDFS